MLRLTRVTWNSPEDLKHRKHHVTIWLAPQLDGDVCYCHIQRPCADPSVIGETGLVAVEYESSNDSAGAARVDVVLQQVQRLNWMCKLRVPSQGVQRLQKLSGVSYQS